jgi:hypothetical protein
MAVFSNCPGTRAFHAGEEPRSLEFWVSRLPGCFRQPGLQMLTSFRPQYTLSDQTSFMNNTSFIKEKLFLALYFLVTNPCVDFGHNILSAN